MEEEGSIWSLERVCDLICVAWELKSWHRMECDLISRPEL